MDESSCLLAEKMVSPTDFTGAKRSAKGKKPQAIAHRGYKAAHPENTMGAFVGAVEVGAHAIETDVHLSKDGVVVLSHDPTLKRCFGVDKKICDCDWNYLKTLKTVQEPQETMPRLRDLLKYLAKPGLEHIWVLLDIKLDDDPETLFKLLASTIADVTPSKPWNQRLVLGCWLAKLLPLCFRYLPGFPITHIGVSIEYARQFFNVKGVSFNMLQQVMVGPFGNAMRKKIKKDNRSLFLWTVNEVEVMKWSIRKEVDGVITDDPKKYLEVCDTYEGAPIHFSAATWAKIILMNILSRVFLIVIYWRDFKLKVKKNKPIEA
ncbi:PLC-like phosphodiesterase [Glarea lozoyensis ATCC 20868]|uniref:PLC-like phosphodiesterase n=1 Tax=Glarea lozoyensis (strain ATCC 20868 / MF5171) TaxID=1116229 RepID=S3CX20_GLAL2|nr:PLC-like phosphodiesterase [Glarea lozoyensis ATCC 20868]EPE29484.1 PLC-like phosphodiesterase [Glarea lozoyensis ATCC 20868]